MGQNSSPIEIKTTSLTRNRDNNEADNNSPYGSPRWKQIIDSSETSESSKEELITKLLEDSLRKARENGEILDQSSGEAILKILKQSLLKSCSGGEATIEPGYFRPSSSLTGTVDLVNDRNAFLEENPYEIIKEPIYEEIPDEPPPLPLSPPPSEDFLKNRIFFVDEYKDTTYRGRDDFVIIQLY